MNGRRWTEDEIETVRRLRCEVGQSYDEIAAVVQHPSASVKVVCAIRKWLLPPGAKHQIGLRAAEKRAARRKMNGMGQGHAP